jgi:hypothetical protein
MRVFNRDKNCVIAVEYAKCDGKQLVFMTVAGVGYRTDDYYAENIALCTLSDLAKNGYIIVDKLYIKEDF